MHKRQSLLLIQVEFEFFFVKHRFSQCHSGYGTCIDEYKLKKSSCEFVTQHRPPMTCALNEGIWCVRYSSETDQLGFAILDAYTTQWRFELRTRDKWTIVWQVALPFLSGDCEISPIINGDWIATNTVNIRLIHISNGQLKSAVEYERELKNAIVVGRNFLVIRAKGTIEFHRVDSKK